MSYKIVLSFLLLICVASTGLCQDVTKLNLPPGFNKCRGILHPERKAFGWRWIATRYYFGAD